VAVVKFKCDTCLRTIELPRNKDSIETIKRCIITKGCRGSLKQEQLLDNFVRGRPVTPVEGLENWIQRKALFNFTQSVSRSEWLIKHDMGIFPSVVVFINAPTETDPNNQSEIIPDDIIAIDENNIKLVFSKAVAGIAQLIARETDPDIFTSVSQATSVLDTTPIQITANTQLTLANLIKNELSGPVVNIKYQITYFPPNNVTPVIIEYIANTVPQIESPWSGFNTIVIKGKVYRVRSFDIQVPEMANGIIGPGSTFQFTGIAYDTGSSPSPLNEGDAYVLLANSPYTVFDVITNKLIDTTKSNSTQNAFAFSFNQGEMLTDPNIITNLFPQIRPTT